MTPSHSRRRRLRDLLLYVLIAVALVTAIFVFAAYDDRHGRTPQLPIKWLAFAGLTMIVFGYTIQEHRAQWKSQQFWRFLLLLFVGHILAVGSILLKFDSVPLLVMAGVAAVEFPVLNSWLDRLDSL